MATAAVTPDNDAVLAEVFIAAPPERVFQAITDPQQMPLWWGQQGLYRVTEWKADLRPGGKWQSDGVGADGTTFRVEGEYLEVDPPRLLVHTWIASYAPALKTVVRWELEARGVHNLQHVGSTESRDGHVRENPPRWICRQCRTGEGPRRRLDPGARLDAGVCRRGEDDRHARAMQRCIVAPILRLPGGGRAPPRY